MKKKVFTILLGFLGMFSSCNQSDVIEEQVLTNYPQLMYLDNKGQISNQGDSLQQILSFGTLDDYENFKSYLRTLNKNELKIFFKKLRFRNIEEIAENADAELERIGTLSTSKDDFYKRYKRYVKKYENILVRNSSDTTDLSLYIPASNDEVIDKSIVSATKAIVVAGKVLKIPFSEEINSRDKNIFATEYQCVENKNAMNKAPLSSYEFERDWPLNGFIEKRGHKKTIFSCKVIKRKYVELHFGAQKKMWYGWKRDNDRNFFFATEALTGFKVEYNPLEIQKTSKGIIPIGLDLKGKVPYLEVYYFPSPYSPFAYLSNHDFKFGEVEIKYMQIPNISGKFFIWTDMMTGSDDIKYFSIPAGFPVLDKKRSIPCRVDITY
ncbi:MAG: DUF4848 domain-containing protein [Prevotella sp.]|nr:DUF4848 domain-containing protein [Prevotella sp.]MDY4217498.1 DUF4848 domain-containing protein [Prevotella sp.]